MPNKHKLMPSLDILMQSYSLCLKGYEQIGIMLLLPSLVTALGSLYFHSGAINYTKDHVLDNNLYLGISLIVLGTIWQIINYSPAIYFFNESAKKRTPPTLAECYRIGKQKYSKILLSAAVSYIGLILSILALIVPFIVFFPRLILMPYFAADNPNLSLAEIFKMSLTATKPYFEDIWNVYLLTLLILIVLDILFSSLTFGVIFLSTLSYVTAFMPAILYHQIVSFKNTPTNKV